MRASRAFVAPFCQLRGPTGAIPSQGLECQLQRGPSRVESRPYVPLILPASGRSFNVQNILQKGLHAQHADTASGLVCEGMEVPPIPISPTRLHFSEILRNLSLEGIQNAVNHGVIALEHLLEVIEVIMY